MLTRVTLPAYTYQYAATELGNIAYRETGKGPAAIFVHGVFLNGHLWDRVIERLGDIRRCIAIDILAHGKTGARADQDLSFDGKPTCSLRSAMRWACTRSTSSPMTAAARSPRFSPPAIPNATTA